MYALYGHPRYFKFKQKYQQYGPCFQTIFLHLMTMFIDKKKHENGVTVTVKLTCDKDIVAAADYTESFSGND